MKKLLRSRSWWVITALLFGVAVFNPSDGLAQCALGASQYPGTTVAGPTTASTTTVSTCNYYGEYSVVSGFYANNVYILAVTGTAPYVTVYDASNAVVAYGPSPFTWTPATSGTYKLKWSNTSCGTDSNCHSTSVQLTGPAAPPAPTQNSGTPTCPSGATLTVSGSPATGSQWYWQTSATGTSTATPYSGPYTVYTNATYYIRTFNSTSNLWSAASSVTVSNIPVATPPPAPTAAENPTCVTTGTNLTEAAAPAGYTYYWQGTNATGSSTANPATSPYFVNATGTYYVSAYETATQCWSNGVGISVTANSVIPAAPTAPTNVFNFCTTDSPMNISVTPALAPGAQCSVTATASGTDNTGVTASVTSFACNSGTIVAASMNASIGGNCPTWYYYSIKVNGNIVATQQCNQTNFNLTPYLPLTSVQIISADNPADGFGDFVTMNLSVNLTYGGSPYTVTWFNAATAGTSVGTGTPLNALGTSVMPTAATGSYSFYAGSNASGCPSSSRTLVTANVADVSAVINPVNATCNGLANGSFTLGTVSCGTAPFTYAVDGGAFGPIPTNLAAGTHTVQIRDANNLLSSVMNLVITQPGVSTALTADANYFSATLGWTAQGDETSWVVEYGPAGFTQGTGTIINPATNPQTITGLTANTQYQFYVAAGCSPTSAFAGPFSFATNPGFMAYDNTCTDFIDISATGTNANLVDDSELGVTLPWPWNVNGTIVNTISIGNNGGVMLNTLTGNVAYDPLGPGLYPYIQDLNTANTTGGVFYQSIGSTPGQRKYVIMWKDITHYTFPVATDGATFEIVIDEATSDVFYLYQDVMMGSTAWNNGADAVISANNGPQSVTVSSNSATYLTNNSCVRIYGALCPKASNLAFTPSETDADATWSAGPYGETEWVVIYGPAGFDPATEGITDTVSANSAYLAPLEQNTQYDVYIYSLCAADDLTSEGLFGTFTTVPFCSTPTALTAATDVDSLEAAWNWTLNPNYTDYAVQSFTIEYGPTGFTLGDGEMYTANGTNNADTVVDADFFLAGGIYQYYVQAVCGSGDSVSAWAGPISFTMPLSNDLVCSAETLPVDGIARTFNNTGATVSTNEGSIAPPATGAQTTTGWVNQTLNGTVWFKFVAPNSGNVRVNATGINYNGQAAVYSVDECSNFATFELQAANDDAIGGTSLAPNFTICGLTPSEEYYLMFDAFNTTFGNYSMAISAINLEAGMANASPAILNVCTGSPVELFNTINGQQTGGVWSSSIPSVEVSISGSTLNTAGLAYATYDLQYRVTDGCAYDSVFGKVQIYAPSDAGNDGSITACRNQSINLYTGLGGTANLGGTWYTPAGAVNANGSYVTTSNTQGNYNYTYIAGNGVCPNDTAIVVVNVGSCNVLDLEEQTFAGVEVFPNPSAGIVFVTSDNNFSYEVTDANGRVITSAQNGVKAAQKTEINLSNVERGVYFIRLNNEDAQRVYRVVIN